MSQCVPSWDLDDNPRLPLRHHSSNSSSSLLPDCSMLDYEVAELTWENGQLAMHGLGLPRPATKQLVANSVPAKYTWDKPRAGGTLESIVNQATSFPKGKPAAAAGGPGEEMVPWFDDRRASAAAAATMTMDALVPCSNGKPEPAASAGHVLEGIGPCVVGCSTRVGSCSGAATNNTLEKNTGKALKRARLAARVPVAAAPEWSSRDNSVSGSATYSRPMTLDTCERELGAYGFTSTTSMGSPENTSSAKQCTKTTTTGDDHDSVCHSRPQRVAGEKKEENRKTKGKSSVSTKRSRAAAIHNQSERKRRDKINQRMKTLQKLVPNSSKTDKASMLDEVIEYLKQLQAQVQMMSRMNMSSMMMPMTLQQQLQLSMMASMGMGMGMGVMDINTMGRPNLTGMHPVFHPAAFMPMAPWDGSSDRLPAQATSVIPDPMAPFLACQQPMTMDAYSRMAALYQQLHQPPPSVPKE